MGAAYSFKNMGNFIDWLKRIFGSDPLTGAEGNPEGEVNNEEPLWVEIAKREIGVKEVSGGENPRILEYDAATDLSAKEDEVAWCSAFLCWCLSKAGYKTTRSAWAQSYTNYGEKLTAPKVGCIVVFRWSASSGHVGFCVDFNSESVTILGGNQSNAVNEKEFLRSSQIVGYRWPVKL